MACNSDMVQFSKTFDNFECQDTLNVWINKLRQDIMHDFDKQKEEKEKNKQY